MEKMEKRNARQWPQQQITHEWDKPRPTINPAVSFLMYLLKQRSHSVFPSDPAIQSLSLSCRSIFILAFRADFSERLSVKFTMACFRQIGTNSADVVINLFYQCRWKARTATLPLKPLIWKFHKMYPMPKFPPHFALCLLPWRSSFLFP